MLSSDTKRWQDELVEGLLDEPTDDEQYKDTFTLERIGDGDVHVTFVRQSATHKIIRADSSPNRTSALMILSGMLKIK